MMLIRATTALFLRADPSTDNPPLTLLAEGTVLTTTTTHGWRQVTVGSQVGWVASEYTEEVQAPVPGDATPGSEETFSLQDLLPLFQNAEAAYGTPAEVLAAVAYQESGFKNWRVHRDGTGHGLFGLDDNGMLPGYEEWSGTSIGRGPGADLIPIAPQILYTASVLKDYHDRLGSWDSAVAAWHRGEGQYQDSRGQNYAALIRAHEASLFA